MRERPGYDPGQRALLGIVLGLSAYSLLTGQDAINKLLVAGLPVWQILFLRSVLVLSGCLAIGRTGLLARCVASRMKSALLLRGAITFAAWIAYFSAARTMPLGQLTTLYFAGPFLTTLMAGPMLGERVTRSRWASVLIGLLGVMVASDPGGITASWATGLVLAAAAMWAYAIILMRRIALHEPTLVQMVYQNLFFLAGAGALCLFGWHSPSREQWLLIGAIGLCGGTGQFLLLQAARFAAAAVLATVEYSSLLWAFLLGFAIWGDVPLPAVLAGAGLIVLSGGVLVVSERRRSLQARSL